MKTLILLAVFFAGVAADAHKIKCFAAAEDGKVAGYAWMSGGVRPKGIPFKVVDSKGNTIAQGKTGDNGEFSFVPKVRDNLTITVNAGAGHVAKFVVKANELPAEFPSSPPAASANSAVSDDKERSDTAAGEGAVSPKVAAGELEAVVKRAVSAEIAPLRMELAEFKERERLQDIVAGLGFIAGITGVVFFMLGLNKNRNKE